MHNRAAVEGVMESGRVTRAWMERMDPAEFQEISAMISDVQREREMARRQKLEQRQSVARKKKGRNSRYLELERVKCGKKGCRKCASGELHGPYWYLYRPKENRPGRTSQYVGKVLPETLAEEFDIPGDQRTSN